MNQKSNETEVGTLPELQDPAVPQPKYANEPVNLMSMSSTAKDLDTAMQNAEKFVAFQDKIRRIAIRVTNPHDWVDEGGNPYLQEQGAQKIAMCFGVSIGNVWFEKEQTTDDKGDMITYYYHGEATWQGRVSPQMGNCSSRDSFFGKRQGELLPLSEVKLVDVRKKAYTNMLNRAIKSCLGLSYTWQEIAESSDNRITRDIVVGAGKGVAYDKGTRGGATKPAESQEDKDKKADLWNMMVELYGGEKPAKTALEKATTWTNAEGKEVKGKRDISKVTVKQVGFIYPKIKTAYDKHLKNQAKAADFRGEEPNGN